MSSSLQTAALAADSGDDSYMNVAVEAIECGETVELHTALLQLKHNYSRLAKERASLQE